MTVLLVLLVVGLFAGNAAADEGQVTNVTSDSTGHLTVSWSLTKPSGTGTVYAQFVCVKEGSINTGDVALTECSKFYSPQPASTSDSNPVSSFTTPDTFAPGTYQVSLMVDYVYVFDTDSYYNDSTTTCSVDTNIYDPWLFICASGVQSWLPVFAYAVPDTTAPGAVGTPSVTPLNTGTAVQLNCVSASDNVGVTQYQVTRDGAPVGTVQSTDFLDTGLTPHSTHTYGISAVDAAGNVGPATTVSATTDYQCVVPNVKGMTLVAARTKLAKSHCELGKVKHAIAKPLGRIRSQRVAPGGHLRFEAPVDVVIGARKR